MDFNAEFGYEPKDLLVRQAKWRCRGDFWYAWGFAG